MKTLYRHNKSGRLYLLEGTAIREGDCVMMALYASTRDPTARWCRPSEEFHELIPLPYYFWGLGEQLVHRFERLEK